MTAFARTTATGEFGELQWELRGVNHRYLELSLRLPDTLRALEGAVREAAQQALKRGKVDLTLRHVPPPQSTLLEVDDALLTALLGAAGQVQARLPAGATAAPDVYALLRWPGVLRAPEGPDTDTLSPAALALLGDALAEFIATREREGERLAELIRERATQARTRVAQVRTRLPRLTAAYRARLEERVAALGASVDPARIEQEIVLLVQRSDPAEELDRLELHLTEVERTLAQGGAVGRRLDFLMQELTREANTLGSKANDMDVTQAAVALKVLIEQMREQIQNIE